MADIGGDRSYGFDSAEMPVVGTFRKVRRHQVHVRCEQKAGRGGRRHAVAAGHCGSSQHAPTDVTGSDGTMKPDYHEVGLRWFP
jgi:hypothetical protein